jgi:hypothetical protein
MIINSDFIYPFKLIFDIKNIDDFKKMSRIYLGNVASKDNNFYNGPYEIDYMFDVERQESIKAVSNGLTDYSLDEVTYKVNEFGYRGEWTDFSNAANSIATFGCSFTFGVGSSIDNLWTEILAKKLNKFLYNFGVGGTGIEHCALIYSLLSHFVHFDTVIVMVPQYSRVLFPKISPRNFLEMNNFLREWSVKGAYTEALRSKVYDLYDNSHLLYKLLYNINLMINVAKINNTKIYFGSWHEHTHNFMTEIFSDKINILPLFLVKPDTNWYPGRDGSHAGKVSNNLMAENFYNILKSS